jgi:hypothetical protein
MSSLRVYLQGGLGNQLFQLAFLQHMHEKTGLPILLTEAEQAVNPHSKEEYYTTLFKSFAKYIQPLSSQTIKLFEKQTQEYENWARIVKLHPGLSVLFVGYFQRQEYVPASFASLLCFPTQIVENYPRLHESAFLHIRGGDYIYNPSHSVVHNVGLTEYYKRAIAFYKERRVTHFYVFTNDIEYAKRINILDESCMTLVNESHEVSTLYLMTQCKQGGICANSSFSWWGGYLNSARPIVLPSKWYNTNTIHYTGLYYPGSVVIPV